MGLLYTGQLPAVDPSLMADIETELVKQDAVVPVVVKSIDADRVLQRAAEARSMGIKWGFASALFALIRAGLTSREGKPGAKGTDPTLLNGIVIAASTLAVLSAIDLVQSVRLKTYAATLVTQQADLPVPFGLGNRLKGIA